MLSRFFLDRPVFAWVIAIAMMLGGGLAIYNLPISQYPPIAPPSISIRAAYVGGSAKTVEDSVTQIIEQSLTGLDRMLYMSSTSDSSGAAQITLTFAPGTDPDMAWSKVQNKLQSALPSLPESVQSRGVTVAKSTRNYLMLVGLTSDVPGTRVEDLGDYAVSTVQSVLARVPGVGEVDVMGSGYAMRIWLDPDKLAKYNMTPSDVVTAVRGYNVEVSAGQLGGAPAVPGQRLNASILVQSFLVTPEQFASVPLRTNADGSIVRVSDVGRAELGTEAADIKGQFNGLPSTMMAIRQEAGANALDTANAVKAAMSDLSRFFPKGMRAIYPMDTTPFVRVAIGEVVKTLFEAVLLVFLVMYLFLGNLRATLIPTIAVPVVILGTFGVLGLLGYSINMLTMFAMVLAIGLLVDDAIVVVENVERVMSEEGLSPREATRKSMDEITSALVGIGLVLAAVFGPMAFFPGSTGVIYRQFSVTVIASMLLSVVVALVLSPVLCASLLKPVEKGHEAAETGFRLLRPFFLWFDRGFNAARSGYTRAVGHVLARRIRYAVVFVLIVACLGVLFSRMPTGYLPDEDQGTLMGIIQLPVGSTTEQTESVIGEIRDYFLSKEQAAVESVMAVAGTGMAGRGQNQAMSYVKLRDWDLRRDPRQSAKAVAGRAMGALSRVKGASIFFVPPPPVTELGTATGFDFMLLDRGGLGHDALSRARDQLIGMAAGDRRLTRVRPNGMVDVPQYKVDIDWAKAGALGVSVSAVQSYLATAFGSTYINDFVQNARVKRVYAQLDAPFRMLPGDVDHLMVRNTAGRLVPLTAVASGRWVYGPPRLERYNAVPSMNIQGEPAPGRSTGEAMQAMEELCRKLPPGIDFAWTGISYQQRMSESQTGLLYTFSVLVIFLVLAALYESWTVPIAIVLALPLGVIGGVLASTARGLPSDVYFQIGLLTVLGLTTKNAILIVQFAQQHLEEGMGLIEATIQGAKLRLRPIVMTSLAFGMGVLPLAISTGAGAGAQVAIGTSVMGGMLTGTFLAIFFIPLFYVLVVQLFRRGHRPSARTAAKSATTVSVFLLAVTALSLGGCSLAPQYARPATPVPAQLPPAAVSADAPQAMSVPWRDFIRDPKLRTLVEQALINNRDLRAAMLNVERAQATFNIQRAERMPAVSAVAQVSNQHVPEKSASSGTASTNTSYSIALGVSGWEVDLFGRVKNLTTAALESYLAQEQTGRAAQLALVAAVAQAYLNRAADAEYVNLARSTLEAQQQSLTLIRRSLDVGVATELDLNQVQSQVEAARADIARFTGLLAVDLNALQVLVGGPVAPDLLPDGLAAVTPPMPVSAGLTSEVLLTRPDIMAFEHQLRAAYANIGVARAAYFPRITLTAGVGISSKELSDLLGAGTGAWSFIPNIAQPIFNAGATKNRIRVSQIDRDLAVARYEKGIQQAFAEVSNALTLRETYINQREAQGALVQSLEKTYRLSSARHDAGIDGYLPVLVAQRALIAAQQGLVAVRLAEQNNLITLYKVLGGF